MLGVKSIGSNVTAVAVMLAAAASTGCQGGLAVTEAPERSIRSGARRSLETMAEKAGSNPVPIVDLDGGAGDDTRDRDADPARDQYASDDDERRSRECRDGRTADRDESASGCEGDDRTAEGDRAGSLEIYVVQEPGVEDPTATDLEYTLGLPEPPRSEVLPPPPAWAPPPDAEANAKPVVEDVWPDKGPSSGGDHVVIRGKNLEVALVLFGLTPARILSESDDAVTVAAPPGDDGHVAIVVTNRDGNYAIAGDAFRYYR